MAGSLPNCPCSTSSAIISARAAKHAVNSLASRSIPSPIPWGNSFLAHLQLYYFSGVFADQYDRLRLVPRVVHDVSSHASRASSNCNRLPGYSRTQERYLILSIERGSASDRWYAFEERITWYEYKQGESTGELTGTGPGRCLNAGSPVALYRKLI
jgi:hypothetical protein